MWWRISWMKAPRWWLNWAAPREFYHINLRNRAEIFEMAKAVHQSYGRIDILVNCAGIARPCPTMKLPEDLLDEVIDINMKAPLFCCQAVGRYMRRDGGGSIINISSGNTRMINVGRVPYGITKGCQSAHHAAGRRMGHVQHQGKCHCSRMDPHRNGGKPAERYFG